MFSFLKGEIVKKNLKVKDIADNLGINEKTLRNKLNGETEFTWNEVCKIQKDHFPEIKLEQLFEKNPK